MTAPHVSSDLAIESAFRRRIASLTRFAIVWGCAAWATWLLVSASLEVLTYADSNWLIGPYDRNALSTRVAGAVLLLGISLSIRSKCRGFRDSSTGDSAL